MNRQTRVCLVAAPLAMLVVMGVLMLAASSDAVRLWRTPGSSVSAPGGGAGRSDQPAPAQVVPADRNDSSPWNGTLLLQILGALLVVVVALVMVDAGRVSPWPRLHRRRHDQSDARLAILPEVRERQLAVDVEAARAALAGGDPRNAIVACWMQLERDAGTAGLARMAAETPAEFVERVVATSSIDPAPISELAALYREARFSRHALGDSHRASAFAALDRVVGSLARRVAVRA